MQVLQQPRMSIAYDVENDFILDADMTALSTRGRTLALHHLEQARKITAFGRNSVSS